MDRFGDIPRSVDNLLRVAELKAMAHRAYATEVNINRQEVRIELFPKAKLDISGIPGLVAFEKTVKYCKEKGLIVIGNEGHGIPREISSLATGSVYIPISEKTESLNASVAAAIFMWEQSK